MSQACCFINTEQPPTKVENLRVFKYSYDLDRKLRVFEMCELFYPHPEAPENAIVSIYRWQEVSFALGTEELIKQCVDAMKGITSLIH